MTNLEYQILDELYFMTSFSSLENKLKMNEKELKEALKSLIEKGWLNHFEGDDSVMLDYDNATFEENFKSYYYLASKKGLFEHNSN